MGCNELIETAPDAVQVLIDSYAEGILFTRNDLAAANQVFQADPMYRGYPLEIINLMNDKLNNLYKPDWFFPHPEFWAKKTEQSPAGCTRQAGCKTRLQPNNISQFCPSVRYGNVPEARMENSGKAMLSPHRLARDGRKPPYPTYDNEETLSTAQAFPGPGELGKDWMFGGKKYRA